MADRKGREQPSSEEIQDALSRALESGAFARSERARELLDYIVTQEQAGNGRLLKGFAIAQDVFGKDDDFDPSTDAVVRVQAGRLRDILSAYYDDEGKSDPVQLVVPRGTYVPSYVYNDNPPDIESEWNSNELESEPDPSIQSDAIDFGRPTSQLDLTNDNLPLAENVDVPDGNIAASAEPDPSIAKTIKRMSLALIGLFLLLAIILYLLLTNLYRDNGRANLTPRASTSVQAATNLPTIAISANSNLESDWAYRLQNALFRFSTVRLVSVEGLTDENPQAQFVINLKPRDDGTVDITLVQSSDNAVIWSGNIVANSDSKTVDNFTLPGALTDMFTPSGKLYTRLAENDALSGLPACLFETNAYFVAQDLERYKSAYDCHNILLQENNISSLVYADTASLMVERLLGKHAYPDDITPQNTFMMAQRGIETGVLPENYRSLSYYFAYRGDTQAAENASQTAYTLNPFNLEFAASYAFALERAWAYDHAQEMMELAIDGAVIKPYWWYYTLFVSAYANNDLETAARATTVLAGSPRSQHIAARLIVASFEENLSLKSRLLAELEALDTSFTRDPRGHYNKTQSPGIAARLTRSLISTGFNVQKNL